MNKIDANAIDRMCRTRFTYEVKPFNLLHWRSHRAEVELHEGWSGPCGDLTSTVMDFITENTPLQDCYRLLVSLEHADKPDHIVGCVRTDDAGFVIVGDTARPGAYSCTGMPHRVIEYNRLSEAGANPVWRSGAPWQV